MPGVGYSGQASELVGLLLALGRLLDMRPLDPARPFRSLLNIGCLSRVLSGGQLALLLDWRRWCGRLWVVVVAKHCAAVHWAGAGAAVVMLVARFAALVSLEENIAN
jgi:hypothetical protein